MVEFKNVVPDKYQQSRKRVDNKIKVLVHRYTQLECDCTQHHSYCHAMVEVNMFNGFFAYRLPVTCCRNFEAQLTVILSDEVLYYPTYYVKRSMVGWLRKRNPDLKGEYANVDF